MIYKKNKTLPIFISRTTIFSWNANLNQLLFILQLNLDLPEPV